MAGWFWRHRKIRNSVFYFPVSWFAFFVVMFSQPSYDCGLWHVRSLLPVWGMSHVVTVGPGQAYLVARAGARP
jgi:hypothetical protein